MIITFPIKYYFMKMNFTNYFRLNNNFISHQWYNFVIIIEITNYNCFLIKFKKKVS